MTQDSRRGRRLRYAIVAAALIAVATIVGGRVMSPMLSDYVRQQIVEQTARHFDGTVEIGDVHVSLLPGILVAGRDLVVSRGGDPEPLIRIASFSVETSLLAVLSGRIRSVAVDGLTITVPPDDPEASADVNDVDDANDAAVTAGDAQDDSGGAHQGSSAGRGLRIDRIACTDAVLIIQPDDPGGSAQVFIIQDVRLEEFSLDGPADYTAQLINPRPRGPIVSSGQFGPWNSDAPRLTPLAGDYTMTDSDMSVFNGLSGHLTTTGQFEGVLESIDIEGTSTMPDFAVDVGRHPMRLDTTYEARVDGTTGNTYLTRVDARLGESDIHAAGAVAGMPGGDGKRVTLDVTARNARLEDFIYLVVDEPESPMLGRIDLQHTLDLPPGDRPVVDRLELAGTFTIANGHFTGDGVQAKVDELSRRSQGQPDDERIAGMLSTFSGDFTMRDGVIELPDLNFEVSGARIHLRGRYLTRGAALDFQGHLTAEANVSEMTTGFKSWLLKVVDPFLRGDHGGAEVPIRITGTVHAPSVGLNVFGGSDPDE